MPRCSAAGLDFGIIPAGFNAPLEFLTGFTEVIYTLFGNFGSLEVSFLHVLRRLESGHHV
jgi:hypothetical protein